MNDDFPYQAAAVGDTLDLLDAGKRRIVEYAPCGAGKTRVVRRLVEHFNDLGVNSILYTNRKMLIDQLVSDFVDARIPHGVRAADYDEELDQPFQISSIQTENARVLKRGTWRLHDARFVLVDEPHLQTADVARAILDAHIARGASYIGFDATPLGLSHLYEHLHPICYTSDCRKVGSIVVSDHYGPDEPDWKAFLRARKRAKQTVPADGADLSAAQAKAAMMTPGIFGRVWEWFEKLNPRHLPTLLFAAGVPESKWFAERFTERGVRWAHIDGDNIWLDGEERPSTSDLRDHVCDLHRQGKIIGISNRYVMREGVDLPWVRHVIAATIFGSITTFLQTLGRGGRADWKEDTNALFGPKHRCVIQDHGGNWWRHGSVNADFRFDLSDTDGGVYGVRADRIRNGQEREPERCPACGRIVAYYRCPCGHVFAKGKPARPVVSTDGTLRLMTGTTFPKRRISSRPDGPKIWARCYYASKNPKAKIHKGKRTFAAAAAAYASLSKWEYPNPTWPLMPKFPRDFYRAVKDVPESRLIGYCELCSRAPCRCDRYGAPPNEQPREISLFDAGVPQQADGGQLVPQQATSQTHSATDGQPGAPG